MAAPGIFNKFAHVCWWVILDALVGTSRDQEFLNVVGQYGAWIEIPKMFARHNDEDVLNRKRRKYFLEYGRYP